MMVLLMNNLSIVPAVVILLKIRRSFISISFLISLLEVTVYEVVVIPFPISQSALDSRTLGTSIHE